MLRPEAEIISKHLRVLVGERNPFTSLNQLQTTGQYLSEQFHKLQLGVLKQETPFNGIKTHNILGHKTGTEKTGGTFVLGAHYDTVEGTPGADDNASAVAALLEIARCLQPVPLKSSLIFAGFTLEEHGFVGSRYFVQQARQSNLPIRGMISMEMVGFRTRQPGSQSYPSYVDPAQYPETGDFIALVSNEPSQTLARSLAEAMRKAVPRLPVELLILPGRGDPFVEARLSDHAPFWDNNYQAIMVTDTAFFRNPNYHQPTDDMDTLDIGFIRDVAAGIAGFLESHLNASLGTDDSKT